MAVKTKNAAAILCFDSSLDFILDFVSACEFSSVIFLVLKYRANPNVGLPFGNSSC